MIMDETYWIEFRDPGTLTRFETDDWVAAVSLLESAVLDVHAKLINYSYSLDGSIDDLLRRLDSVKIAYPAKAA
jgi:hypothetical protein